MWLVINIFRDFLIIVGYNFKDVVKKGSFKVFTGVMTLLLIIGIFLTNFIFQYDLNSKSKDYLVYIIDSENHIFNNHLDINLYMTKMDNLIKNKYYFQFLQDDINIDRIKEEMLKGEIDGYVFVNTPNNIDIVTTNSFPELNFVLDKFISNKRMESLLELQNKNVDEYKMEYNVQSIELNKNKIKSIIETYTIPIMFMFLSYILFIMYGQFISISVNLEKNSKIFEILLTKVKLSNIILGKIFGVMLAGLLQIIYFMLIIFGMIFLFSFTKTPINEILNINLGFVFKYIIYFILGFLIYGFMFFSVGSNVSKTEDLPINLAPTMFLVSISYFVGNICLQFSQYSFISFLKYIPTFAPFVIPFDNSVHWLSEIIILFTIVAFILGIYLLNIRTVGKKLMKS